MLVCISANAMVLTEVIVNRSHDEIALLNKAYVQKHGRELSKHIAEKSDMSISADLKRREFAFGREVRDRSYNRSVHYGAG